MLNPQCLLCLVVFSFCQLLIQKLAEFKKKVEVWKGSASNLAVLSLDGDSNKENNCDDLELNFIVENMRFLSEKIVSFLTFMFVRDEDLLDKKPWVTFYSVLGVSAYH